MSGGPSDCVLIFADEARSARAIERILGSAGYATIIADSFDVAYEVILAGEASLVLMSLLGSENQSALEFCRRAKSVSNLPIILMSWDGAQKAAAFAAGATDYILRPCHKSELLTRVKAHLRSWRYEREMAGRLQELNLLHAISSVLSSSLEPEALLKGALSVLVRTMLADGGVAYLHTGGGQAASIVAVEGFTLREKEQQALLGLMSKLMPLMNGKPLLMEPMPAAFSAKLADSSLEGVSALACAPLGLKENRVGAICLFSRDQRPFSGRLPELLSTVCNQLSVALENARLYVETRKSASLLSFLYNLGNNLMTSLEMEELLGYAVFSVGKSLDCDVCAIVVKAQSQPEGVASGIYTRHHSSRYEHISDWCHVDRVMEYLNGAGAAQPTIETRVLERFLRNRRVVVETVIPLAFDEVMLGVLITGSFSQRHFSQDEQRLLGAVAQQIGLAIRNIELFQQTRDTSINLAVEVARRTRQIEEQKRFTEKIIDSLPVSLYVVDRDLKIVAWNRNREVGDRGLSREEAIGKSVFQVLATQPRQKLEEEFIEVFRTGQILRMEQESWIEGQKKYWRISKIPMRVDNAEVTHVITVGEDITEQKRMNDAVIHAEKLASIGRLAAGVVHEINNPLATISACAEALSLRLEEMADSAIKEDFAEYLRIIRDESFRCKTITNNLLDFSRSRPAEKQLSDINIVLDHTLQLIKHHPTLGKMNIIRELDMSLPKVYVNDGQLKQVFIALISNAFDAMEGRGTLTIRTRHHQLEGRPAACIEFIDTGCGIPAAHLPNIFDPFFTTKPLGRGTGLGLSVCYGIVSEHGGKIEVDSIEGAGSTFRVLLPLLGQGSGNCEVQKCAEN
jgi:two-component system NtrC family sensor kinase